MVLAQENSVGRGGSNTGARRGYGVQQVDITQKTEVEIELTESEPTIQQQQAYERFWKLFIERTITMRLNKNT